MHNNLRVLWGLVGGIDACEFANLSGTRFFVEVLRIARLANFQRRINKDFDKFGVAFQSNLSRAAAIHPVRRDKRSDYHRTGIGHEFGDFTDAANIFYPIIWREPEI